jgi:flavin reductase (DIM6/NTAB) family NADH-FMN oxidoreductase RutF
MSEGPMESDAFEAIMSSLDARLIVVTTEVDGERAACLVGFHAQASIDPGRYAVWLSKANHTYRVGLRSAYLGLHFLTTDDLTLAERFGTLSGDDIDKFDGLDVVGDGATGVPILGAGPNWLVARRTALLDEGGDHVCVALEPLTAHSAGRFEPLRLSAASHLTPGHSNEERNSPPTERARPPARH